MSFQDMTVRFQPNPWPTLGVEVELQLVDDHSWSLRSAAREVLDGLPEALRDSVKPEFMQCYVEVNTGVCRTVDDVAADLGAKVRAVEAVAARQGVRLFWAATHPFSRWWDQRITPDERYGKLADLLGETVIRPVTFGLHVHVGVESGDRAIRVIAGLQRHLPVLLALSANSPFWHGRETGHHAHRVELLEGFPTGGLPPRLRDWDDYRGLLGQLIRAGFIESHHDIWWDVRPSAEHGTVEVRICDMPPDLPTLLALSALIQCLVHDLSARAASGLEEPEAHPLMLRQNRWRACRYGLEADLVDLQSLEPAPARRVADALAGRLGGIAGELGCLSHLERVRELAAGPTGAERQLAIYRETGDLGEVVRGLVGRGAPPRATGGPHTPVVAWAPAATPCAGRRGASSRPDFGSAGGPLPKSR